MIRTFIGCLAALAVAGIVKFELTYRANRRAINYAFKWTAFDIGTMVDTHRFVDGSISSEEYMAKQDEREKALHS